MRTIKFRAWDKDEKNMLYAGVHDRNWYATPKNDSGGCHTVRGKMPEDRIYLELMQFTGLLDKNGKEIYEGDILLCDDQGEYFPQEYSEEKDEYLPVGKYVVEWSEHYPAFDLKGNPCEEFNGLAHCIAVGSIEVIGNKFENPELLGGGANG